MSAVKQLPLFKDMADDALDEVAEELATLASLQGSADPCVQSIHNALAKLLSAVSLTLSAMDERRE